MSNSERTNGKRFNPRAEKFMKLREAYFKPDLQPLVANHKASFKEVLQYMNGLHSFGENEYEKLKTIEDFSDSPIDIAHYLSREEKVEVLIGVVALKAIMRSRIDEFRQEQLFGIIPSISSAIQEEKEPRV